MTDIDISVLIHPYKLSHFDLIVSFRLLHQEPHWDRIKYIISTSNIKCHHASIITSIEDMFHLAPVNLVMSPQNALVQNGSVFEISNVGGIFDL